MYSIQILSTIGQNLIGSIMNKKPESREHLIFTSNGINGACYAALVLMKFPDARIQITSMSHLESALDDLVESSFEGDLHICGVGYSGPMNDVYATLKRLPKQIAVNWYAGSEYPEITKTETKLSKVCHTRFDKEATAKIICSAFNLKRSDSLILITELLEDVIANRWRTEFHRTWANRIGASNYRYFFFSDDSANDHTMRALAGNVPFSKGIDSLIKPFLEPENRNDFPLGSSKEMKQLRNLIGRIGPIPAPALILGPTGSGKDVVARSIHVASGRRGEYIAFNCAVLGSNPQIAESRLWCPESGGLISACRWHEPIDEF